MVSGQASSEGCGSRRSEYQPQYQTASEVRLLSHTCYNELTIAVERTVQPILPLHGYAAMASGHRQLGILTGEQRLHLVTRLLV